MKIQNEVDSQLYKSKIITFNGQGCSGKTTQSKLLVKAKFSSSAESYQRIHIYKLRSDFEDKVYNQLGHKDVCIKFPGDRCEPLYNVEVLGIPTLAWLTVYFHLKVKPLLLDGANIVLDHYLGDYYAEMLAGADVENFRCLVRENLAIPDFDHGTHFYLDIDYATYQDRWHKREETEPPVCPSIFKERRKRYHELCELTPLECIDSTRCESVVAEEIQNFLDQK